MGWQILSKQTHHWVPWRYRPVFPLPMGTREWNGSFENGLTVSYKFPHTLIIWSGDPTPRYLPNRNQNTHSHPKIAYMSIYRSISYNNQNLDMIQMSFNWWMDKQTLYPYNGILLSNENHWKKCVGESQKGYEVWRKLDSGYTQYVCDFILNDAKL